MQTFLRHTEDPAGGPLRARRRRFLLLWLLICAFWGSISLVSALEMAFLESADLAKSIWYALARAAPWMLLSPLIFWVSARFTFEGKSWKRSLWAHLGVCVLCLGCVGYLAYVGPSTPVLSRQGRDTRSKTFVVLQRVTLQLPSFWGLVGISYALGFYERSKARELREAELESHLAAARLRALRMQLNPHFLFNTLNSIATLVHEKPQAADDMISSLSELLRLSLRGPDRQEVSLNEELQFLDRYLQIEQIRFGTRLRIEKEIETGALDALVPTLILQPLVENAIKHGIEARLGLSIIRITARHRGDTLRLKVMDNGAGLRGDLDGGLKEGVGLSNTRSRLKVLYGESAGLELRSEENGFSAEIRIPWGARVIAPEPEPTLVA